MQRRHEENIPYIILETHYSHYPIMIQTVLKRDGRIVGFNEQKIAAAIRKAMLTTDAGEDNELISKITDRVSMRGKSQMTVEEIQDMVEDELMKSSRPDVARIYIKYRSARTIARKAKTRDIFLEIINIKNNDVTRENANMNADTPAGMMMKFSSETTKPFVDDYLLSDEVKDAVKNNYLHIHDKDYYPTKSLTCVQHPLDRILKYGFQAGHGESRPAKRIETASILGCISMETVQNEMHGGQAIPAFDFYLAPYVRSSYVEEIKTIESLSGIDLKHLYDAPIEDYITRELDFLQGDERFKQHAINRTINRVHQSMEAFIHNMNTIHSRGGNQVVFSSINYGTDTSAEGRCIIRELLTSTYEGVNVEVMRYINGKLLAQADKLAHTADDVEYVCGVPDSGTPHAIGYSNEKICKRSYLQMKAFLEYFGLLDGSSE